MISIWDEAVALSKSVSDVPSMLAPNEPKFINWHMQEVYTGVGAAVELGCFLGGSTTAALDGLARNDRPEARGQKLHVYDQFLWQGNQTFFSATSHARRDELEQRAQNDPSFRPIFEEHIAPWKQQVVIHAGNVLNNNWTGEPVEYLFIDIMKSPKLAAHIVMELFPHLIPGVSWVIHQDYRHSYTYWIHLLSYRLREYLIPARLVKNSPTVAFQCHTSPLVSACEYATDFESFSRAEIDDAFSWSLGFCRLDGNEYLLSETESAWMRTYIDSIERIGKSRVSAALKIQSFKQQIQDLFQLESPTHNQNLDEPDSFPNMNPRIERQQLQPKNIETVERYGATILKRYVEDDDVIINMHIPKTGGISLMLAIKEMLQLGGHKAAILGINHRQVSSKQAMEDFDIQNMQGYTVITGHWDYLLCEMYPQLIPIVLLRHPIKRMISDFKFVYRTNVPTMHKLHHLMNEEHWTLGNYTRKMSSYIANLQTRYIAGYMHLRSPDDIPDDELLNIAKQNLVNFAFVGITEHFEESIKLLAYTFDWPMPQEIFRENVAPPQQDGFPPITEQDIDAVRQATLLDQELYRYAKAIFSLNYRLAFGHSPNN